MSSYLPKTLVDSWSQTGPPEAQLPVKMRKLIGVDPGWKQRGYDLSNAELRIVAELSQDTLFLDSFAEGWDLHTLTACELFGLEYPPSRRKNDIHTGDIDSEWRAQYDWQGEEDLRRKFGKVFAFRSLYGGSPKTAHTIPGAGKLGLSRSELEQSAYRWLAAHPALNAFWDKHGLEAVERYTVRNAFGRRRVLCSTDDNSRWREGINHPVQSFVSDLINRIVVETYRRGNHLTIDLGGRWSGRTGPSEVRLCGQMHDSLLWAFPTEKFPELAQMALDVAQSDLQLGTFTFKFPVSFYDKECP